MENSEVAKIIKKKLEEKGYDVSFNKILDDLDISFNDNIEEKDIENIVDSYLAELEY